MAHEASPYIYWVLHTFGRLDAATIPSVHFTAPGVNVHTLATMGL